MVSKRRSTTPRIIKKRGATRKRTRSAKVSRKIRRRKSTIKRSTERMLVLKVIRYLMGLKVPSASGASLLRGLNMTKTKLLSISKAIRDPNTKRRYKSLISSISIGSVKNKQFPLKLYRFQQSAAKI